MLTVKSLESALPYLTCTDAVCGGSLELGSASFKSGSLGKEIDSGRLACSCGREYDITGGIPYFFDSCGKRVERGVAEIKADIARYANEGKASLCLDCFTEMAYRLSENCGSDMEAIKAVFDYETELMGGRLVAEQKAAVSQAATTARYNLENYRGCYTLPRDVANRLRELVTPDGVIFEGAMATGENLVKLANEFGGLAMGIDISERMARRAQETANGSGNIFIAQGSLECVPLKSGAAKLVNVNNVLDRIPDPPLVARELGRISKSGGVSAIFNCYPLQFVSPDGSKVYVPDGKRMGISEMTRAAGFAVAEEFGVNDLPAWRLETVFDGKERLIMEGVLGRKK
jgi:ubiquinone/menaquinone biosynthesis C-methylase UbiE